MSLPKVYVGLPIQEAGLELLRGKVEFKIWKEDGPPSREVLFKELEGADGLISGLPFRVDGELMDVSPKLKVVSNYAVGYDNIDVPAATKRGILITNTPDVLTAATADLALLLILATARRAFEANEFMRSGKWKTWGPDLLVGMEVSGSTIGIIGMGKIGGAVARRAFGFGMKIIYYSEERRLDIEESCGAKFVSMEELLKESDIVTLHCLLNEQTRNMFGEAQFQMMKKTAIFINTARGAIVDQKALYKACSEKWIWAAGLDVYEAEPVPLDDPILKLTNVTTLPHIASASNVSRNGMARKAAINLLEALQGNRPPDLVNPEAWK
ncbi:MAG: D-glycerate dehydrogenase [Synergistaceae bacterium]|nr:D-glycerate dehydrogenase [Synergistaceae bacterium]